MVISEILSHFMVTIIYFLVITILRGKIDINLLWLWIGVMMGMFLLDVDHLVWWFVTHPEEEDSKAALGIWKTKGVSGVGELKRLLYENHHKHIRLIFHSVLFQVILLILAFYALTSSNNFFVFGLVLSVNLHLLKDEWQDFFRDKQQLCNWLFWQINQENICRYTNLYLTIVSIIFLILSVLVIY